MTWETMTEEQRNRRVAEALGYTVYHYDKDYKANQYYCLMDPQFQPVYKVGQSWRGNERPTEAEAWEYAPAFTTDHAAVVEVRAEVARRGLQEQFVEALIQIVGGKDMLRRHEMRGLHSDQLFALLNATPEQQCRAALRAFGEAV